MFKEEEKAQSKKKGEVRASRIKEEIEARSVSAKVTISVTIFVRINCRIVVSRSKIMYGCGVFARRWATRS